MLEGDPQTPGGWAGWEASEHRPDCELYLLYRFWCLSQGCVLPTWSSEPRCLSRIGTAAERTSHLRLHGKRERILKKPAFCTPATWLQAGSHCSVQLRTWGLLVLRGLRSRSPISEGSTKSTRLQPGGRRITLLKLNHKQERRNYDPWSCKELGSVTQWLRYLPETDKDVSSAFFPPKSSSPTLISMLSSSLFFSFYLVYIFLIKSSTTTGSV